MPLVGPKTYLICVRPTVLSFLVLPFWNFVRTRVKSARMKVLNNYFPPPWLGEGFYPSQSEDIAFRGSHGFPLRLVEPRSTREYPRLIGDTPRRCKRGKYIFLPSHHFPWFSRALHPINTVPGRITIRGNLLFPIACNPRASPERHLPSNNPRRMLIRGNFIWTPPGRARGSTTYVYSYVLFILCTY